MNKKVSVIMAAYNSEDTLPEAVESIINQSYDNWEMIICNDGSSDSTYKKAKEYEKADSRIKAINNETRKGAAYSRNRCFSFASGEYIAIQDADDISDTERLEKQVAFLERNPQYALAGSWANMFDEDGMWGCLNPGSRPGKTDLAKGISFVHPSLMLRSEVLEKLEGYTVDRRTRRGEDYEMIMRLYALGYFGANLQEAIYNIRVDRANYRRRKFVYRIDEMVMRFYGYRRLKLPLWSYAYVFKPLIAGLIPGRIMKLYHKSRFNK